MVLASLFTRLTSTHLAAVFRNWCFAMKDNVQSISHKLYICPEGDCSMLCSAVAAVLEWLELCSRLLQVQHSLD